MSWRKIRPIILAMLAAFLVICVSGIAIANGDNEIHIFKMGTDVTVPEQQVMTDAVAIGGDVILKPNARVGGDAVAIGGQIIKEEGAMVGGSEVAIFSNAQVLLERFGLWGTLFKSGMFGLGGIAAITLFSALVAGSVLGFLLIPITNLAFAVAGLLGAISAGLWVGRQIFPRRKVAFIPFLVGMFILVVISLIPLAGGLIILMLDLFGFGAVLLSRVGTVQPEMIQKRFDQLEGIAQPSEG